MRGSCALQPPTVGRGGEGGPEAPPRQWAAADLAVVGADVGGVIEVQAGLPAEPPAVQAGLGVHQHIVEVLLGPQRPHQLTCTGSSVSALPAAQAPLPPPPPPAPCQPQCRNCLALGAQRWIQQGSRPECSLASFPQDSTCLRLG